MKLSFASTFLSIHSFPDVEIPNFCLLTGLNGAGKSHLLQALVAGHIRADCAPRAGQEIRLFDWSTLVPQDTGIFTSDALRNERMNLYQQFQSQMNNLNALEPAREFARSNKLDAKYVADPQKLLSLTNSEFQRESGDDFDAKLKLFDTVKHQLERHLMSRFDQNTQFAFQGLAERRGKSVAALVESDFTTTTVPSWGQVNIFQQSFARLFVAYRDLQLANDIREFQASKGKDVDFLTHAAFEAENGPAPWDFVNNSLISADLDFQINIPALDDYTAFQPQLTKISNGINVPFANLSSGEKILMSLAFCVYYSNDRRQISSCPKIILLDEVDAPLHPSMSKNLLSTVQRSLVESFGINVIATTHSPSTVALAPEESVYTMKPGTPGLHKTTRAQALNILTIGVPTLAISYDGRRQVFVESPSNAKTYDGLYKLLKPRFRSGRSLEFVATGTRSAEGEERNTGCDVVKRIVTDLSKTGNISVFGLLDWDGKHADQPRLAVLAEGSRNGLENAVLDPLILLLLIVRQYPTKKSIINIPEGMTFVGLINSLEDPLILPILDNITQLVLGSPAVKRHRAQYIDGLELEIDERFYTTDDHEIEKKVIQAFPFLKSISNRAGALMEHIILTVLTDCVAAIPVEIFNVMHDLLNRNIE